jgi:hypothetical protein
MTLTGCLMFVYICIDVGDPVERRVGMPLTGSLMFVYICIGVSDPVEGLMTSQHSPLLDRKYQYIYRQTLATC